MSQKWMLTIGIIQKEVDDSVADMERDPLHYFSTLALLLIAEF